MAGALITAAGGRQQMVMVAGGALLRLEKTDEIEVEPWQVRYYNHRARAENSAGSLDARLWRSLGNPLTSSAAYITRLEPCKSVAG